MDDTNWRTRKQFLFLKCTWFKFFFFNYLNYYKWYAVYAPSYLITHKNIQSILQHLLKNRPVVSNLKIIWKKREMCSASKWWLSFSLFWKTTLPSTAVPLNSSFAVHLQRAWKYTHVYCLVNCFSSHFMLVANVKLWNVWYEKRIEGNDVTNTRSSIHFIHWPHSVENKTKKNNFLLTAL